MTAITFVRELFDLEVDASGWVLVQGEETGGARIRPRPAAAQDTSAWTRLLKRTLRSAPRVRSLALRVDTLDGDAFTRITIACQSGFLLTAPLASAAPHPVDAHVRRALAHARLASRAHAHAHARRGSTGRSVVLGPMAVAQLVAASADRRDALATAGSESDPERLVVPRGEASSRGAPLGFVVDHFEETAGCDTPTFRALAVGRAAGAARTSWMAISRSRFTAALDDPKRRGRLVLGTCVGSLHVYAPSVTLEARSWSSAS